MKRLASFFASLLSLLLLVVAAPARAENVYIMDLALGGIYSVDINAGGPSTLLVSITPPAGADGYTLATRPSDGMLFYLDSNGANPNLWRWNPDTPTVAPVLVGTPGASTTGVVRLGFDALGRLLAMDTTNYMWTLDTSTGGIITTTPLTGDLPTQSGDLCLNSSTGVLYMVANQDVYTVTGTGVSTRLGTVTNIGTGVNGLVTGCAFTRDGTLLISLYGGGALRRVNLTTLAATALPQSTGITSIGDLSTAPERDADLSLTKTASTATPGATVSFTITVSNAGPARATDVRVLDPLPAGLALQSTTPSQGIYSPAAVGIHPAGTWRVGTVPAGASATLTLVAAVTGSTPITNTAQVSYVDQYDSDSVPNNGVAAEDDQASVTITPSPDLKLAKVATSSFSVGSTATYALTVTNTGSAATSGTYTVTDVLPAGLSYVSATGTGWACSHAGGTVTCSSATAIAVGASAPAITLSVLVAAPAAPSVTNSASVAGGGEPANNSGNNSGSVSTAVCDANCPDLRVNKTGPATMTVGTAASYTLSVSNIGGLATTAGYTLVDALPAGLTLATVPAGTGWTCTAAGPTTNVVGGTTVSCTRAIVVLPGATSSNITFNVNVAGAAVPSVVNTATVSGGGEPAAAQGNNSSSLASAVSDYDVVVSKTAGTLTVGANSTYVFTVGNIGTRATAGAYSFTDVLPAGLTIAANSPGTGTANGWTIGAGWTCARDAGVASTNEAGNNRIFCTRSTAIAAGASSTTVTVPVVVAAAAAPAVTNTVTVTGTGEAAAYQGNNDFSRVSPVNAVDLVITKSHNGSFAVGNTETYTITATNIGQVATVGNYTVVDTLPAGLTYLAAAGTGWACSQASGVVTCVRGTALGVNVSAPPITISVRPTAAAASASPVVNTATISGGNEPAGNSGNNSASDPTGVFYPPVLAKTFTPASIPAGGTATLRLTITNPAASGIASLAGVEVTDPFPAGMSVANTPALVNTCGGTVLSGALQGATMLALTGGSTGGPGTSCYVEVRVTATGVGTKVNTTSEVRSSNGGIGNIASANLITTSIAAPILTKVSAPGVVGVGENALLAFTITNNATATNDMGFADTLPANVTVPAGAVFGGTCASTTGSALSRTISADRRTITVGGVDVVANGSCTVTIPIRSNVAGSYTNNSSNISGLAGGLTAASLSDTLVVEAVTLTKSFTPAAISVNATSTMALVLSNGPGAPEQNGIAFTETLPAGVVLALAPAASQCGGAVAGTAGGATVTLSGASLAAGLQGCTVTAVVTAAAAGTYTNAAGNVTGLSGNLVNSVNATLTVSVPAGNLPGLLKTNNQSSIAPGDTTTYVITVSNNTGSTFSGGSAVVFKDPPVANLALASAACAPQGGATCPALASAAMITAMQGAAGLTIPSMPNNSTVVFTITAQLTGNPTGTLTNSATATANGGTATAADSDTIVYPSLVNAKTVLVLSDPVNGTTNPKAIPGAEALYTITITNTGLGSVNADVLQITDQIPGNTELFVGDLGGAPGGPVTFAEGAVPSGLALTTAELSYSTDGGANFVAYSPGTGFSAAITHLRINPKGRMAAWSGSGGHPSFSLNFKVRIR